MIEDLEKSAKKGRFTLPYGRKFQGELKLAGRDSFLSLEVLNSKSLGDTLSGFFPDNSQDVGSIKGVLSDSKKVSLLHCMATGFGFHLVGKKFTYNDRFLPRFAVFGDQHILHNEKKITGVSFIIDDADMLFYDPSLFGAVTDKDKATTLRPLVEQIAQHNDYGQETNIEEHPQCFYYTGKTKIFEAGTNLGTVSASRSIKGTFGNSKGFKVENIVSINLEFAKAITVNEAVEKAFRVLRFLELLVGRPQNLLKFLVRKKTGQINSEELEVYGSFFPRYERPENKQISFKALINAVRNPEEFSRTLKNWLERHDSRLHARSKFFYSFGKRIYDADRLISVANMFDVLPKEDSPHKPELDEEIKIAVEESKIIWEGALKHTKKNSESQKQCKSILGKLGSIGKNVNLKEKICHRSEKVIEKIEDKVPELGWVIGKAVICRNHYTHRDRPEAIKNCDKVKNFLTETLEFVFAASELVEAGWDIENWGYNKSSHPFGRYLGSYENHLKHYRKDLGKLKR